MKVQSTEKFISKFAQWDGLSGYPNLKSLPKILRDLIYVEYPKRDGTFDIIVKSEVEPNNISFTYEKDNLWIWQQNGIFHTAVERPYWSRGLKEHIKDEILYDPISWFFHFSAQYIERSRRLDIIGAIALVYDVPLHIFTHTTTLFTAGDDGFYDIEDIRKECKITKSLTKRKYGVKEKQVCNIIRNLNCLNPDIHRMLFNYIRALKLEQDGYVEESVAALDKTINVAHKIAISTLNEVSDFEDRNEVMSKIGINIEDRKTIDWLYELRSHFGAHPSITKWWDFAEILDDDYDILKDATKNVIFKIITLEKENRIVDKYPDSWSKWLQVNAMLLWDAVWFENFPERK